MSHSLRAISLFLLYIVVIVSAEVTLFSTGELHGSVENVQNIATFMTQKASQTTPLLVDGGGFVAGGIYDLFTAGRVADSLQSIKIWKEMSLLGYDAVALGDEELQYGALFIKEQQQVAPLPLVSANISIAGVSSVEPYRIIEKDGIRFAVTSVVTSQQILLYGEGVSVSSAKKALDSLIPLLAKKADYIIVLAHTGEVVSKKILQSYPQVAIVINGHKKSSSEPIELFNKQIIMNFGFLGTDIASVTFSQDHITPLMSWNHIQDIPTTPSVRPRAVEKFDLYVMSSCSYGDVAILALLDVADATPIDLSIWYIGSLKNGELVPGLATGSRKQEMLTLAISYLYPERFYDYLWLKLEQKLSCEDAVSELGFDKDTLSLWIKENGAATLSVHYRRSHALQVSASPTLWINNRIYPQSITAPRILFGACRDGVISGEACDTLGECLSDSDCPNSDTTIGVCIKNGRRGSCSAQVEPMLTLTTILPDAPLWTIDQNFYRETEALFPTLETEDVVLSSESASSIKKILSQTGKVRLPLIYIDSSLVKAHNYTKVAALFEPCGSYLCLKNDERPDGYYTNRPFHEGRISLEVDTLLVSADIVDFLQKEYSDYPIKEGELGIPFGVWLHNRELFTAPTLRDLDELILSIRRYLDAP